MAERWEALKDKLANFRAPSMRPEVALKMLDLAKDPEVEVGDYICLVQSDPALSCVILSLANSAYYAPRTTIDTVKGAVSMIGLNRLRVVALSQCVVSLHESLSLESSDSRALWAASVYKALAAWHVAGVVSPQHQDESFTVGLLQDLGCAVLRSIDPGLVDQLFQSETIEEQMDQEREIFGMDHAVVGRLVGEKLHLPPVYLDAIDIHHRRPTHFDLSTDNAISLACFAASLFPHALPWRTTSSVNWMPTEVSRLRHLLERMDRPEWDGISGLLAVVDSDFEDFDSMFDKDIPSSPRLLEVLKAASMESAEATAALIKQDHGKRSF